MKRKRNKNNKNHLKNKSLGSKIYNVFFDDDDNNFNNVPKNTFSILEVIIITLISILFGIIIGYVITFTHSSYSILNSNPKLKEIINTYDNILENYYEDIDEGDLADSAVKGMISSLDDPYSSYMDLDLTSDFNRTVDGSFVGIGVTIKYENDFNIIIEVNEDGPADKAGLKVGDIIVNVDGNDVSGMNGSQLSDLICGEAGTKVNVTVKRNDKEKSITVTRSVVELDVVSSDVIDYNGESVGYINIDVFSANSYAQFKSALSDLEDKNISSLVIDVRGNPGGHLDQVSKILSLFFNKKTILYQVQSKNSIDKIKSLSNVSRKYPVAVLINNASASASEVLASCFQDNYKKAIVVGTTSYGKGTVQKSQSLVSGSSIKFTTQKWLTSKGEWLNGVGVKPEIEIEQSLEYVNNPSYDTDAQLQEALRKIK